MSEYLFGSRISSQQENYSEAFENGKSVLQSLTASKNNSSVYSHLLIVLKRLLTERPTNAIDIFEHLSRESKLYKDPSTYRLVIDRSTEIALAKVQRNLFDNANGEEETLQEDSGEAIFPNFLKSSFHFEQAGIGLSQQENMRIMLGLKRLSERQSLQSLRFWGKILGTEQNYYIAEGTYREGEEVEEEMEEEEHFNEEEEKDDDKSEAAEEEVDSKLPKPTWKAPPIVPKEKSSGANKNVYFVCNELGQQWTKLPPTTPAHIVAARNIKKYFTGRLDAPIHSFPPFPGTEINYLRAQIARISAGAIISPAGYYHFDDEEEETPEEGGVRENFTKNPEYEGMQLTDHLDPNNWVHHVAHILPQGRCSWWNPIQKGHNDFDDEEEEEENRGGLGESVQPEMGPTILSPLSEDIPIGSMSAWTFQISSNYFAEQGMAIVSSNLWPGAYAIAHKNTFDNVYIGWGHKYTGEEYQTKQMPNPQSEFIEHPGVHETHDPTPEEEAALHAAKAIAMEEGQEKEAEEDEEDD